MRTVCPRTPSGPGSEAWIEQGVAEDALPEPDLVGEILPMVQRSELTSPSPGGLEGNTQGVRPGPKTFPEAQTRD